MRIFLAIRVFFKILFSRQLADSVRQLLRGNGTKSSNDKAKAVQKPKPVQPVVRKPERSEALTLLAALQREARFIDIVKEPLGDYSDEQIGAAARDVLRDTADVLQRFFDIQPLVEAEEGSTIEAPEDFDPQHYHLVGNVSENGPLSGQLVHPGWVARKCEVPKWSGRKESRLIIAPVEIQV